MKRILVIGSANIDLVIRVPRMPAVGETLMSDAFARIPGGKGANQACACGRLGGHVAFLGAVGQDELGELAVRGMADAGVDCSHVLHCANQSTGMAVIYVNGEGDNNIVVVAGANAACDQAYLLSHQDLLTKADIVMAQLEVPTDGVYAALKAAHAMGKTTLLNPAPAPEALPADVYPALDYITPNETELSRLTGCDAGSMAGIVLGVQTLLRRGVRNVIVTLGSAGAMLQNRETQACFAPPPAHAVDTTAAGDTFSGALAVKLAEGEPIERAIRFANAAAAVSVSRKGAQSSIPMRAEVEEALRKSVT